MKATFFIAAVFGACAFLSACNGAQPTNDKPEQIPDATGSGTIAAPVFNADTAYAYVGRQVAFGPRTPGSPGQEKCAAWMQRQMRQYCDTVYRQQTTVKGGDGKMLPCINLVGAINPKAGKRILLLTHWDSRPWGDEDSKGQDKPIPAADDAASGVGVLLELARQLKSQGLPDAIGVDILMTDVEDYGRTEWGENSYCLGTQYWARNPHVPGYKASFGILLDMVGARGATFPLEGYSTEYASEVQKAVYQAAARAGYSSWFPFIPAAHITDDHKFVNELAHIPTIDIINLNTSGETAFKPHWHTHQDNMDVIDKATLKAVGQTLLQVVYENAAKARDVPL